jgi:sigma-E factor negative regulatory protein RseC
MEELATVVHVDNNTVSIMSEVKSACSGCQQVDNCGSGQVAKAFPTKKLSLTLESDLPLKVGDTVVLGLSDACLLQSAWQVYLFPLIGLISFSGVGQYFISNGMLPHELFGVVLSALGGYLGYSLAKNKQSSSKNKARLTPKILRILTERITVIES